MISILLAHLLVDHWRLGEFLLYGGAGVGLVGGVGLFLWGRHERRASSTPWVSDEDQPPQGALIKRV